MVVSVTGYHIIVGYHQNSGQHWVAAGPPDQVASTINSQLQHDNGRFMGGEVGCWYMHKLVSLMLGLGLTCCTSRDLHTSGYAVGNQSWKASNWLTDSEGMWLSAVVLLTVLNCMPVDSRDNADCLSTVLHDTASTALMQAAISSADKKAQRTVITNMHHPLQLGRAVLRA
jgi:hypothetical protein